jgi:hypothetical protein
MTVDPTDFNQPDLRHLAPEDIDRVGRAVVTLALELAVVANRLMVLEDVLTNNGLDVENLIESHRPDADAQARLDAATQRIVSGLVSALSNP